jgi:hypothetical protein
LIELRETLNNKLNGVIKEFYKKRPLELLHKNESFVIPEARRAQ